MKSNKMLLVVAVAVLTLVGVSNAFAECDARIQVGSTFTDQYAYATICPSWDPAGDAGTVSVGMLAFPVERCSIAVTDSKNNETLTCSTADPAMMDLIRSIQAGDSIYVSKSLDSYYCTQVRVKRSGH